MNLPFLQPELWATAKVDVLFAEGERADPVSAQENAVRAYQPVGRVPRLLFCRTSDSEKRLEGKIEARIVADGHWGMLHEVLGAGGTIGFALAPSTSAFSGAHVLPDIAHFVSGAHDLPEGSVVSHLYDNKTLRIFLLGATGGSFPQDLLVTTKNRWFRNRINPKFLGFSKNDERT